MEHLRVSSFLRRRAITSILAAAVALLLALQPMSTLTIPQADAVTFGAAKQVTASGKVFVSTVTRDFTPLVTTGNNVYIAYVEAVSGSTELYFIKSSNSGTTFDSPIQITNSGTARWARLAAEGNNVYLAFAQEVPNPPFSNTRSAIFVSVSNDDGNSFSPPTKVSNAEGTGDTSFPIIAASGPNVYVAWTGARPAGSPSTPVAPLSMTISTDSGASFGAPFVVSGTTNHASFANMAASGSDLLVAWGADAGSFSDVFVSKSVDAGTSFSTPVNVSNNPGSSGLAKVAFAGTNAYVVWTDNSPSGVINGPSDTLFAASSDSGTSFGSPINVSNNPESSFEAEIALSDGNVVLTWHGPTTGSTAQKVWYATSADFGTSFSAPVILNTATQAGRPEIASSGSHVAITWEGSSGASCCIWVAESIDSGISFGAPVNIKPGGVSGSNLPQIAISDDYVHVAWHEFAGTVNPGSDVWFNAGTNDKPVDPLPPVADANGPYSTDESSPMTLDGSESFDPDGTIVSYEWDLDNDGEYDDATGPMPSIAFEDNGLFTIGLKVTDDSGLTDTDTSEVAVNNVNPVVDAGDGATINEGDTFAGSGSFSDPGADSWAAAVDYGDGIGVQPLTLNADLTFGLSHSYADDDADDMFTVSVTVSDDDGGTGSSTTIVTVNNLPPVLGIITAPIEPTVVNTQITAGASFTDAGILDTHSGEWDWGDGTTSSGIVTESGGSGNVEGSHTYESPGVYTIELTITDDDGGTANQVFQYVVVYDPDGGFITGGGWIDSPAGSFPADPSLTGKANFGFVSKYLKGSTTPTGNTEFQFKAGDLHFKSSDYEYLVIQISNAKAQFMGEGTINGEGNYGFKLTAVDADVNSNDSHASDKFRIKIWDKNNGDTIVYDNQIGAEDDADPTTVIGGGSIKIHKS